MIIQRRNFLVGLASALAAPAIVRAESLMPVRALAPPSPKIITLGWRDPRGIADTTYHLYRVMRADGTDDFIALADGQQFPVEVKYSAKMGTIDRAA